MFGLLVTHLALTPSQNSPWLVWAESSLSSLLFLKWWFCGYFFLFLSLFYLQIIFILFCLHLLSILALSCLCVYHISLTFACIQLQLTFSCLSVGVSFLSGQFYKCSDNGVPNRAKCNGIFLQQGIFTERGWQRPISNFDNVGEAMLVLLELSAIKGWKVHLRGALDSTGLDVQPQIHR